MLSLVTICSVYVNKLGVLEIFIEQGNKQVFSIPIGQSDCPITVFC